MLFCFKEGGRKSLEVFFVSSCFGVFFKVLGGFWRLLEVFGVFLEGPKPAGRSSI